VKIISILICGLLMWPLSPKASEFDHAALAQQMLELHIQPGYEQLFSSAQKLETALDAFCGAPSGDDLKQVKDAFTGAALAWSRIQHLRFGPIMKDAAHARMLFWPDRKGLGRRQVARMLKSQDKSVLTLETLQGKSVALQGFGALEFILHSKDAGQILKAGPARTHRCGFSRAISANIKQISRQVLTQWSDAGRYKDIFMNPSADNPVYLEQKEVTLEIAKSFLSGLERVRDIRIAGPLGLQRKSRRRKRAAFERSGLSTKAITANLEGLTWMYKEGGLMQRVGAFEIGMGKAILNELTHSLNHLRSISLAMKPAVDNAETKDKLIAVGFPLKNAHDEANRILASAAGLALGFNALDGD